MIPLADAAPTGAGLAIVGVILLAFAAFVIGGITLVVVFVARRARRKQALTAPAAGWPTPPAGPASG